MRSPYQTIQPGALAVSARAAFLPAVISSAMPILPFAVLPGNRPSTRARTGQAPAPGIPVTFRMDRSGVSHGPGKVGNALLKKEWEE
ncbi:hypothetical protein Mro03_55630 [Microbispora rosea subsp. rosea]|nr:hypothetical protein Mro03_55630 [Microbispora rosea subsp. rosea]